MCLLHARASVVTRIGDNQLGQASVRTVGIHLLNDRGPRIMRAWWRHIIDLGPVNPVEATACGIQGGAVSPADVVGSRAACCADSSAGLRAGEAARSSSDSRAGPRRESVTRGRGGIACKKRIVFSGDATAAPDRRCRKRRWSSRFLSEWWDYDEGSGNCGCSE